LWSALQQVRDSVYLTASPLGSYFGASFEPSGQATKNGLLFGAAVRWFLVFSARLPNYSIIPLDENNVAICKHLVTHNAICYTPS